MSSKHFILFLVCCSFYWNYLLRLYTVISFILKLQIGTAQINCPHEDLSWFQSSYLWLLIFAFRLTSLNHFYALLPNVFKVSLSKSPLPIVTPNCTWQTQGLMTVVVVEYISLCSFSCFSIYYIIFSCPFHNVLTIMCKPCIRWTFSLLLCEDRNKEYVFEGFSFYFKIIKVRYHHKKGEQIQCAGSPQRIDIMV